MSGFDPGSDRLGEDGDAFYELLMKAHEGMTEEDSHALNMRLVLLMANRIGSIGELEAIIQAAKAQPTSTG